jgi:hypothetical protein
MGVPVALIWQPVFIDEQDDEQAHTTYCFLPGYDCANARAKNNWSTAKTRPKYMLRIFPLQDCDGEARAQASQHSGKMRRLPLARHC